MTLKKMLFSAIFISLSFASTAQAFDKGWNWGGWDWEKQSITIWLFSWNNSEACSDPQAAMLNNSNCFIDDIFNLETELGVLHLSGGVTDYWGNITLSGTLYENALRDAPYGPEVDPGQQGIGLRDADNTEIAFIVRTHGTIVQPRTDIQLNQVMDPNCIPVGGDRDCFDQYWGSFPGDATETPVYDLVFAAENRTELPDVFGCASIERRPGSVTVVVHANTKYRKTRWLRKTCGM